jgi:hypothetical protein
MVVSRVLAYAVAIMGLAAVPGCRDVNVITGTYQTLPEAEAAGAVSAGFLPQGLPPGAHDIREAHDPGRPRHWLLFAFPVEEVERDHLRALVQPDEVSVGGMYVEVPGRLEWWPVLLRKRLDAEKIRATGLQTYRSRDGRELWAINWKQGRAYMWTPD